MASWSVFDTVLLYSFIKRLVTPFDKWEAFKTGVIDERGNILIAQNKRNSQQKKSLKMYDLLVMNLKKLLEKIPGGKSRIASYAAALLLLREGEELELDEDDDIMWLKIQSYFDMAEDILTEDAPTTSVGDASSFAGLDDNPPRKMVDPLLRRNKKKKKVKTDGI